MWMWVWAPPATGVGKSLDQFWFHDTNLPQQTSPAETFIFLDEISTRFSDVMARPTQERRALANNLNTF